MSGMVTYRLVGWASSVHYPRSVALCCLALVWITKRVHKILSQLENALTQLIIPNSLAIPPLPALLIVWPPALTLLAPESGVGGCAVVADLLTLLSCSRTWESWRSYSQAAC